MADLVDEKDMYFDTDRLLDFFSSWSCPRVLKFFQCVYKLSSDMAGNNFWKNDDVEIARLWLEDLIRYGYKEPIRVNISGLISKLPSKEQELFKDVSHSNKKVAETKEPPELNMKWSLTTRQGSSVQFVAAEQHPPSVFSKNTTSIEESNFAKHLAQVATICPGNTQFIIKSEVLNSRKTSGFEDVLLIVIFNWPFYTNMKYMEIIQCI